MIRGEKMQLRFWVERGTKWHILMITNSSSLFPNLDYFQPTTCSMGMDWFPAIIKMKKRRTAVGAGSTSWKMFGKKNSRYWNSPVRDYWWWTVYIRLFPGTADVSDYFLPAEIFPDDVSIIGQYFPRIFRSRARHIVSRLGAKIN